MGSNPGLVPGQVPTAAEWNGYFTGKQDDLGFVPLSAGGGQLTGKLSVLSSSSSTAGLNFPPGSAPSSPNNGDMWTTAGGLFVQIAGSTINISGGVINTFSGGTLTGALTCFPSTLSIAGFNLGVTGTIPGSPRNADVWVTSIDGFIRVNSTTLAFTQPARLNTLTQKSSPISTDLLLLYDTVGAALAKVTVNSVVNAIIPNPVQNNISTTFSVGYLFTAFSLGTFSGTVTPAAANGNYQFGTNNGGFTLAAPAADSAMDILVTNGGSAGTITFSGYTVGANTGDALTTSNGSKFIISIRRINGTSTYVIKALQ